MFHILVRLPLAAKDAETAASAKIGGAKIKSPLTALARPDRVGAGGE